jgi:hypothetical protein
MVKCLLDIVKWPWQAINDVIFVKIKKMILSSYKRHNEYWNELTKLGRKWHNRCRIRINVISEQT